MGWFSAAVKMVSGFCLAAVLVSCGSSTGSAAESDLAGGLEGKLVLTGSSTVAPLVAEIGQRFEQLHPKVRVDVQTGGSSRGIADVESGVADIGMSSRSLKADEAQRMVEHPIAFDGVAFLIHASNPVEALSDEELIAIYTGEIDNWREVGGPDLEITAVHRAAGRSEVELITEYFALPPSAIQADLVAGENQQAIKTVAGDPSAIAYMSIGAAQRDIESGVPIKLLPLRGVSATAERVAFGEFPLARPLILLTGAESTELMALFIAFAQSSAIDDLIDSLAYVAPQRS